MKLGMTVNKKYRRFFIIILNDNIEGNIEIDRYHHFGKRRGSRPRTNLCRFLRFKDKQKILQNAKKLKDTGIFIYVQGLL